MDVKDAITQRRSIRRFKPDPVPQEMITEMLEAARLAPSGTNTQPWRFVVVTDRAKLDELYDCTYHCRWIKTAPLIIVACADLSIYERYSVKHVQELGAIEAIEKETSDYLAGMYAQRITQGREVFQGAARQSTSIALSFLDLRATELGLGTCWVGMFYEDKVKEVLNLGEEIHVVDLLPAGFPDQHPAPRPRLPLEEILLATY